MKVLNTYSSGPINNSMVAKSLNDPAADKLLNTLVTIRAQVVARLDFETLEDMVSLPFLRGHGEPPFS